MGLVGSAAHATLFTDNFDRATTTANTDAAVSVGSGYVLAQSTGTRPSTVRVTNPGVVQFNVTGAGTAATGLTLRQTSVELLNGASGESFAVSGDLKTHSAAASLSYGLVFNYQPDGSYYAARINTISTVSSLQFIRVNAAGAVASVKDVGNSVALAFSSIYNLTITSSAVGVFNYVLTGSNLDGGQLTGTATDTIVNLSGGKAGFYMSGANFTPTMDNLSITTIPEPATLGLIALAAAALIGARRFMI